MADARIPTGARVLFVCITMGLSGCNGCRGCEGQTIEAPAPAALPAASVPSATAGQPVRGIDTNPAPSAASTMPLSAQAAQADPQHDPTGVRRCCKEIGDTMASVPDKHKTTWKTALQACNEAIEKNNGRKDLDKVREILTPVGWPAACQ